jgi:hypothetical protein
MPEANRVRRVPLVKLAISPVKNSTSVPQTPTRSTSTTTSPRAATGAGTSCTSPSPGPVRTYARMVRVLIAVIISFAIAG